VFSGKTWLILAMIMFLSVVYTVPLLYFAYIRDEIAFKTRSPKLITIGFIFLYMDSIGNTVIYASRHD